MKKKRSVDKRVKQYEYPDSTQTFFWRLDRRGFLKASCAAVAGLTLPLAGSACKPLEPLVLDPVTPPEGDISVGIARSDTIAETVREAVLLAGGLDRIGSSDTVLIKPNLVTPGSASNERAYTHPEVLQAVIRIVKEHTGPENITVADSSSIGMSSLDVARQSGIYDMVRKEGATFKAWEESNYISVTHPALKYIAGPLQVPADLYSFDHFINVPTLKNHYIENAEYTCCIKNHVGVISWRSRAYDGRGEMLHTEYCAEKVAELNLLVPQHTMNIVDAIDVIVNGGAASNSMIKVDAGLVLASQDRVACDSLAVAVLKYYGALNGIDLPYVTKSVWQQPQIKRCLELELGRTKEHIQIADSGVEEFQSILALWA